MKKHVVILGAFLLLFCGMCVLENSAVTAKPAEPRVEGVSSVYMLAGEFRSVFANLLWIKAEQYHHEFTEHNANWTKNTELMGLIDLITALDPHFVEAYATGAYLYSEGQHNDRKAVDYLRKAISCNPKAWELHQLAAIMYAQHLKDPRHALPYARMAVKYCDDGFYSKVLWRLLKTVERMAAEQKAADSR